MRVVKVALACVLAAATVAMAQETGIRVRSIRVLATDPDALAAFYEKAFGMSETRRPANTATFKESTLMRPAAKSAEGLNYAFVKDPDGNQIELVMEPK